MLKYKWMRYYQELSPMLGKISNHRFHYYLYQIRLLGAMGVFDYEQAKEICTEALNFIRSQNSLYSTAIRNLLLNKLVCHIQLNEFEDGKSTALECEQLLEEGEFNWFKAKEFFFLLSMHTGNYQEAYDTFYRITTHKRFQNYKGLFGEVWSLNQMYLHFLFLLKKIAPHQNDRRFNSIRLGRFINQVPRFAKDKRGMNTSVLIIHIAFLITQKKYNAAEERIDALQRYCTRYLKKKDPNFRCNCFIRMLLQIPLTGFQSNKAKSRAQKYLDKMETIAINFSHQAHEVEVLPFDIMWQFILDSLKVAKE